jgi:hypothetical protein
MDLYTLNPNFLAAAYIDQFVSAIWTERYTAAGDFQLSLPATEDNIIKLAEGTFLGLRGSKDIMIVETIEIENGLMKVTGPSLITFLNHRFAWFINPYAGASIDDRVVDFTDATKKPGEFISHVVNKMVIDTTPFTGTGPAQANLTWDFEEIPYLSLGAIDTSGVAERLTVPIGPLYDGIANVAKEKGVGISLYLNSADPDTGYTLKFKTYRGKDRTKDQSVNPLVRLSPQLDQISKLKELRSNKLYKNVAYIYYQGKIYPRFAEPSLPEPEGLDRRVVVRSPEGEPVARTAYQGYNNSYWGGYTQYYVGPGDVLAFIDQAAKDTFANANYIRNIDGETSPNSEYRYGVDYELGDIIELEGLTGLITKARVTEFIRTEDQLGEKSYPTIAVLES